jgi:5-formyltetrahydrofolate cyclo-ligase
MTEEVSARKAALRRELRLRRALLSSTERAALSAQIAARVLALLEQRGLLERGARIAIYLANAGEANLDALIEKLQARGVEVLAPHFEDEARAFYALAPHGANIAETQWRGLRLRAPAAHPGGVARSASELDAILVPGLGFDTQGHRVGQGGGWYDRVLSEASHVLKIGVAFGFQIVADLPREPHDQNMDCVVTEKRIFEL